MKIAVTGTPGTGKTSVTRLLEEKYKVIHLNDLIKKKNLSNGYDEERKSSIADLEAIKKELPKNGIIESHLSHLLGIKKAIVLRCHPDEIKKRLSQRNSAEIKENQMAEVIDQILIESINKAKEVHEIDTTNKTKEEVAKTIEDIIEGKKEMKPGEIDWNNWLMRNT